jgi:hypothetical protein
LILNAFSAGVSSSQAFSRLSGQPWQAPKYSVRRDGSHWTQVGTIMSEHRIRSGRQHRPASSLMPGADITTRSRGATRPRFAGNFRPSKERAQGMPDARCTRGLVCKIVQRNAHEHTGSAEAIRHSLRNGFTAYIALSPETNSSCLRRRRIEGLSGPGWTNAPPPT